MKKPNTKKHWTALAVARFYEAYETAVRARDLYPLVQEIHETPDRLVSSLNSLDDEGTIAHIVVESPNKGGGTSKTFAYYPTSITIEDLLDIGEPTELPDGTPVTDEMDVSIPRDRVSSEMEEAGEVEPPESTAHGLEYVNMVANKGESHLPKRDYDNSELNGPADARIESESDHPEYDLGGIGDAVEYALDTLTHLCDNCGKTFPSGKALGGHRSHCLHEETTEDTTEDEDDSLPVGRDLSYMEERGLEVVPEWNWWDVSNRLNEMADEAHEAGLARLSTVYTNFASLAMERDLNEGSEVESEAEAILTKELALMLLGAHHREIDPAIIEGDELAHTKAARKAHEVMH